MSYKTLPMDDNTPQIELPYNYLIWKSGSDYIIKNTTTGVKTTGTVFATLLNSAIASATAGDSFFFRPGAYTILAEIDSSVGLNFYGSGIDNTIIRCGAGYAASNHILHFATTVATTPCHIDGITFDGDQGTGQTSAAQGLWIEGMDLTIENCKVMDAYNTGILVFVDDLAVSTVKIVNNTIINAGLGGGAGYGPSIRVDHRAGSTQTIKNVYISGNHCSSGGEHGIKVYDSTADNAEIIGNTILSTAKAGIWCQAGGSVANNVVREAGGNGIVIGDTGVGAAVNCHGNYVYSCGGVESAYRGGIYINNSSPYSTFIGNHIYDSFEHGIQTSSDYCTFVGNTIITAGGYGVVVVSGGDNNVFMDNIINTINKVSDSGSNNRWQNNTGYITENSGTATLLNGQTHVHVTHGLSYTPTLGQISIVWGENPTNVIADWWIDTIGATEFILNGVDPGASNLDFGWSVRRT